MNLNEHIRIVDVPSGIGIVKLLWLELRIGAANWDQVLDRFDAQWRLLRGFGTQGRRQALVELPRCSQLHSQ